MPLPRFYIPSTLCNPSLAATYFPISLKKISGLVKIKPGKIFNGISALALAADPLLWNSVVVASKHFGALVSIYIKG